MTRHTTGIRIESAAVTDRGLSEKRPLNEDSLLNDGGARIFAVADGVGGAEAGEVASQAAIEVLQKAFEHHRAGDDAEDLMEIAIQRANASIYQMSREQPHLSMMATTIVALHLDGWRATIGHVGDSRLYRLTPDGGLRRETDDHSVVEEEVRAGRMTAQQAANHPSRNVISRALGAEPAVEVDLKTLDFENGTTFLLCSDGITRHIPDQELAAVLHNAPSLEDACAEMKRLCYERGAEDNLTAVVIRAGDGVAAAPPRGGGEDEWDEEQTIISERPSQGSAGGAAPPAAREATAPHLRRPFHDAGGAAAVVTQDPPAAPEHNGATAHGDAGTPAEQPAEKRGGAVVVILVLFLLSAASALGFYGGLLYQRRQARESAPALAAAPPASVTESVESDFEMKRMTVDLSPTAEAARMTAQAGNQPLSSTDPEFLYLYGRAMLLTGRDREAASAFDRAIQRIEENTTARHGQLKIDARLASVAARLRAEDVAGARQAAAALDEVIRSGQVGGGAANQANPQASPSVSPF